MLPPKNSILRPAGRKESEARGQESEYRDDLTHCRKGLTEYWILNTEYLQFNSKCEYIAGEIVRIFYATDYDHVIVKQRRILKVEYVAVSRVG